MVRHQPSLFLLRLAAIVGFCAFFGLLLPATASEQKATAASNHSLIVDTLVDGLQHPWALAFLPNSEGLLLTERPGRLRYWQPDTGLSEAIQGLPDVYTRAQGGLLDIALHPDFANNRRVYLSYAEGDTNNKAGTTVGYGRLSDDGKRLENFTVIFRQEPKLSSGHHFGSRLVFDDDNYLFIALGENNQRSTAQDLDKLQGKVVRLHDDGSIPNNNPFVNTAGARPEIWSYGHRNQQGAALHPKTRQLWTHEHGPRGGDEINIPEAGKNYGWPIATYGIDYSGLNIPEAKGTHVEGTEQPIHYWKKSPAISGMAFYDHPRFVPWQNSLFIGALKERALIRLPLENNRIGPEERLLEDFGERIRDVRVGPDGALYVLTDENNGKLLKLSLPE